MNCTPLISIRHSLFVYRPGSLGDSVKKGGGGSKSHPTFHLIPAYIKYHILITRYSSLQINSKLKTYSMLTSTLFILRRGNDNILCFPCVSLWLFKNYCLYIYKSILYFDTFFIRCLHNSTTIIAYQYVLNQMA